MIDVKTKYHVAINDIGFVLQNSPLIGGEAYSVGQASNFVNRLAQGDRTYNDFAKWWYWVQTDWFQGFKDEPSWVDDGKYYYSTNIDAYSSSGALTLAKKPILQGTCPADVVCATAGEVTGQESYMMYVGTSSSAAVYSWDYGTWTNLTSGVYTSGRIQVAKLSTRLGSLWVSTIGTTTANVVLWWNGTTWKDCTANIDAVLSSSWSPKYSRCHVAVGNKMYVFVDNRKGGSWAIVSCTAANPALASDWTKVVEYTGTEGYPVAAIEYDGDIYYLVQHEMYYTELRKYDIAAATDVHVKSFTNSDIWEYGGAGNCLNILNGKLIITAPPKEVWTYDGASFERIYISSTEKTSGLPAADKSIVYLDRGCVIYENRAHWGNLVWDGEHMYNSVKPIDDGNVESLWPLFVTSDGYLLLCDTTNDTKVYMNYTYKGTVDKNFIVLNNFDTVAGLDKIAYSITLLFRKFGTGQSITVEYLTADLDSTATWSVLGTASYTLDGGTATEKTLYFPTNTTFKKLWIRIKMAGNGSTTPMLKDMIMAYLPIPYLDKEWNMYLDCGDELKLLNGGLETRNGRELKSKLEYSWLNRKIVDFQDVDYFQTTLNGILAPGATTVTVLDTTDAPESGRLRIEDEVIYYTGKTKTTFTGLLRGQKGTGAVQHASGVLAHNGYKAIILSMSAYIPVLNNEKKVEYVTKVNLREVV